MLAARMPTVCLLSASIFIIVILTAPSYTTQAWYSMTPPLRRVSIKDDQSAQYFGGSGKGLFYFKLLISEGNFILIGARNYVYNISLDTLQEVGRIKWRVRVEDQSNCQNMMKSSDDCQNYIRVLTHGIEKNSLIVCGTNAFRPLCRTYNFSEDKKYTIVDEKSGIAKCPYDPKQNNTAIMTDRRLFTAAVADFYARDALIFSDPMRTEQHDSFWLNKPDFVASVEVGNMIYFFFREIAVESLNNGWAIYSRVARVCKNDQGGQRVLHNTWTSFFKARLNCSVPGDFPFYFDEIQAVSDMAKGSVVLSSADKQLDSMIYAIFTTPMNSLPGSAVCAFQLSDIVRSFEGAFKEQQTTQSAWMPVRDADVPSPHPAKECINDTTQLSDQTLSFIKKHPLMDKAVPAVGSGPQFIQSNASYRLTQIAVDWQVEGAEGHRYDVIFIGTSDGRVLKTLNKDAVNSTTSMILEDITVFENKSPIIRLVIHRSNDVVKLLVMSEHDFRAIAVERCSSVKLCKKCVALRDPYCSWLNGLCQHSSNGFQNVTSGNHIQCQSSAINDIGYGSKTETADYHLGTEEGKLFSIADTCSTTHSSTVRTSLLTFATSTKPQPEQVFTEDHTNDVHYFISDAISGRVYTECVQQASVGALVILSIVPAIITLVVGFLVGYYLSRRHRKLKPESQKCHYNQRGSFECRTEERLSLKSSQQPDVALTSDYASSPPRTPCVCPTKNRTHSNEYSLVLT